MKSDQQEPAGTTAFSGATKPNGEPITFEHPEAALSVLEADQLVAAKQRTRFGQRQLSRAAKLVLWGLRVYVIIMLVIVLISVIRALHGGN